ncbi:hypothetical protein ACFOJ6_12010 [Gordonia humi]|uniref:hypothetical protein n=1 Tax=Gordonia humi TaxID=686429 RepID=UPI00361B2324
MNCEFKKWGPNWNSGPIWQMHRHMGVKNIGGSTMTHVKVTELFGATKQVPAMKKADLTKAGVKNARDTKAGELLPGQTFTAFTSTWQGCWPSSISGYAIGDQVENIFNNAGFWWNLRQIEPKAPKQTQPTTSASGALVASKAEVLTAVAESPVR